MIGKQVLGELRVTLQRGWSGQHHGTEEREEGKYLQWRSQEGSSEEMFGQREVTVAGGVCTVMLTGCLACHLLFCVLYMQFLLLTALL